MYVGYRNLRPEIEEGICQVLARLWLESEVIPTSGNMPSTSSSSSRSYGSSSSSRSLSKKALRATYCARIIMSDVNEKKSEVRRMVFDFYNSKPGLINAEKEKKKAEAAGHKKKKKMKH